MRFSFSFPLFTSSSSAILVSSNRLSSLYRLLLNELELLMTVSIEELELSSSEGAMLYNSCFSIFSMVFFRVSIVIIIPSFSISSALILWDRVFSLVSCLFIKLFI
uniref:Uncharacterized protein n=1 Tax=Cacopsylla melanoneura TaxID=428564 RepID=A0A8D8TR21_9HEMI